MEWRHALQWKFFNRCTVHSEILVSRVCGGSKFAKNSIIQKIQKNAASPCLSFNMLFVSLYWHPKAFLSVSPTKNPRRMTVASVLVTTEADQPLASL
jgi:hypothetical protein